MKVEALKPVDISKFAEAVVTGPMKPHDGWAALYDVEIERWFGVMELAPKCFSKSTVDPSKILILNQHDSWTPIGKATAFAEKKEGLRMDFAINTEVQAGAEVDSNIRHGVLTGLSVGFSVTKVESEKRGTGAGAYEVDRVLEAELSEVSCVSFPAIDGARIQNSASNGAATFSVTDGEGKRERLSAGDRVTLATYTMPNRIRPIRDDYPQLRAELNRILMS